MTEEERRKRLISWLDIIYTDVRRLLLYDHLFWEFQEIVAQNGNFLKASGLFTKFIAVSYTESAAVGVRRHAKADKDSISIMRFLQEVQTHPEIVSRAHYMGLYQGSEAPYVELGERDFDSGCGSHAGQIFENLIEQAVEGCPNGE